MFADQEEPISVIPAFRGLTLWSYRLHFLEDTDERAAQDCFLDFQLTAPLPMFMTFTLCERGSS